METEFILRVVLLGLAHWVLVPLALENLFARPHVLGGVKFPWVLAIVFVTCFGSLLYLLLHPQPREQKSYGGATRVTFRL